MRYLNRDGGEVEMCGNGARSITHFAHSVLNIPCHGEYTFSTYGSWYVSKAENLWPVKMTELKDENLIDIQDLYEAKSSFYVNTGVPHCCFEVDDLKLVDLIKSGSKIRHDARFLQGTNVNFFSQKGSDISMRTFERGVEGETLSCGTGAIAVVVSLLRQNGYQENFHITVPGGELMVHCRKDDHSLWLAGNVEITEQGKIEI